MNFYMLGTLIGGIGLFLLGMRLMTDGLKFASGRSLRIILESSTSTPLRGIASGLFLTSLVQSSSAVTVATIGFVNAGLMDISHAIYLVYGSNIGTTMTGWLVSLIGFQVNIKIFALPAIGTGMFMRLAGQEGRHGALGDVLAGFGIFFMGIDVLKDSFSGLDSSIQLANLAGTGLANLLIFVGIGLLLTFLMQSSSASIAVVLSAVVSGVISVNDAAAVVIGANVGTTTTAALAVIGATPNARRLAGAHVIFNLITGVVALAILPMLLANLIKLQHHWGMGGGEVTLLAMFHTTFNILGVIILFPMTKLLVRFLNNRFRTAEEDEARPRYLDNTVVATPVLALNAMTMELTRIGTIARRMAKGAISLESGPSVKLRHEMEIIDKLVMAVGEFGSRMQRANLPAELSDQLPDGLRASGYLYDVAELSIEAADFQALLKRNDGAPEIAEKFGLFKKEIIRFLDLTDIDAEGFGVDKARAALDGLKENYRGFKALLLRAATRGEISVGQMVPSLELIARLRRISEQAEKAGRYLAGLRSTEASLVKSTANPAAWENGGPGARRLIAGRRFIPANGRDSSA